MGIELKEPHLVDRLERLAAERTESTDHVLEVAVRSYLDEQEKKAIHKETEAFWAMHPTLVDEYSGRHVAIYNARVVDSDEDVAALVSRVRHRFGNAPVLIAPVRAEGRRDLIWRGGHLDRSDEA
ncbi:MAG: DUF5678 domain-containing protein [Anaerolineae bacterium]